MSAPAKCTAICVYAHPDRPALRQQWPLPEGMTPKPYITKDGRRWPLVAVHTTDTIEIPAPARRAQEA